MLDLLTVAPLSRGGAENRIRESPVTNYRFSFIHATMGVVTIRNALPSDITALREKLYIPYYARHAALFDRFRRQGRIASCPSERELTEFLGCGTIILVTTPRENGELIIAAISIFKADVLPDLRRALENSADGDATVRIDRFTAFEQGACVSGKSLVVGKEVLGKVLGDATRRQGVIVFMHEILVDAAFRKTDLLKFITPKVIRILKYACRCSHVICEDFTASRGAGDVETGNSCRAFFNTFEFGHAEFVREGEGTDFNGTMMIRPLRIVPCETIFDIPLTKRMLRSVPRILVSGPHRSKPRKIKSIF